MKSKKIYYLPLVLFLFSCSDFKSYDIKNGLLNIDIDINKNLSEVERNADRIILNDIENNRQVQISFYPFDNAIMSNDDLLLEIIGSIIKERLNGTSIQDINYGDIDLIDINIKKSNADTIKYIIEDEHSELFNSILLEAYGKKDMGIVIIKVLYNREDTISIEDIDKIIRIEYRKK